MLILGMKLVVHDLDDVSDRDDAHELRIGQDRDLGDMALAHLAHHVVDVIVERSRSSGLAGHYLGDPQPAKAFAAVVNDAQDVALAEDPHQAAGLVVNHRERTDVVLNELGDGFADSRLGIDRNDACRPWPEGRLGPA